ncbi:hypothetical protein WISP_87945 [Willisornis vidua]|uniref:Uncharacterized protein n=1 Tax=Willisornis vidua TaxID=1566151 RepID=A0ABQ9D5A9_9PASS|nr:hypothetical protein WISP_87945 [Willisornis vidua]
MDTPHPSLVSCTKLLMVDSISSSRLSIKMLNRTGPTTDPWGTPLVTGLQLDAALFTNTLWAKPSSHLLTQQRLCLTKLWDCQLFQEHVMGGGVKGFDEVQVDYIHSLPDFHQAGHLVIQADQILHSLCHPSPDTLQYINVLLVVNGPKVNTGFEMLPHYFPVQRDNHYPDLAGHSDHSDLDTNQDVIGLLGHLGTLPAYVQLAVDQHFQVLFCGAVFQPLYTKPGALHGIVLTQGQDWALNNTELLNINSK